MARTDVGASAGLPEYCVPAVSAQSPPKRREDQAVPVDGGDERKRIELF